MCACIRGGAFKEGNAGVFALLGLAIKIASKYIL